MARARSVRRRPRPGGRKRAGRRGLHLLQADDLSRRAGAAGRRRLLDRRSVPGGGAAGCCAGLMTAQLHGLHDSGGEPVAILTASEAGAVRPVRLRPGDQSSVGSQVAHGAAFRAGVRTETVLEIRADRAPDDRQAAVRQGGCDPARVPGQDRRGLDDAVLRSRACCGDGASKRRWAVHPDGYAAYRVKSDWTERGPNFSLQVDEICAATAAGVRLAVAVPARPGPDPRGQLRQGLDRRSAARPVARPAQRHRHRPGSRLAADRRPRPGDRTAHLQRARRAWWSS